MKRNYVSPDLEIHYASLEDILEASDNEVFIDGDNLFGGF